LAKKNHIWRKFWRKDFLTQCEPCVHLRPNIPSNIFRDTDDNPDSLVTTKHVHEHTQVHVNIDIHTTMAKCELQVIRTMENSYI